MRKALRIQIAIYAAMGFPAAALPSSAKVFLCSGHPEDGILSRENHAAENTNTPVPELLSCQCRQKLASDRDGKPYDRSQMCPCMSNALRACSTAPDREMCYGKALSYLENQTLLAVKPVPFIEFATRMNFAILAEIENATRADEP